MGMFDDELVSSPEEGYEHEEETFEEGPEAGQLSEEEEHEETPGEKLLADKYKTPEELETAYVNLQRKLGERDDEKEEMKQRLQLLEQYLLNQQQGYQQQAAPEPEPADFLDEFYDDPASVIDRRVDQLVDQRLSSLNPTLNNVQQFMAEQYYLRKASELAAKYPDFQDMIPAIRELGEKHPNLAQDPNGMELAYQIAKGQQAQRAAGQGQVEAAKRAARMPGSTAGTRRKERQLSEEEAIAESIFGNLKESGGMFD